MWQDKENDVNFEECRGTVTRINSDTSLAVKTDRKQNGYEYSIPEHNKDLFTTSMLAKLSLFVLKFQFSNFIHNKGKDNKPCALKTTANFYFQNTIILTKVVLIKLCFYFPPNLGNIRCGCFRLGHHQCSEIAVKKNCSEKESKHFI